MNIIKFSWIDETLIYAVAKNKFSQAPNICKPGVNTNI